MARDNDRRAPQVAAGPWSFECSECGVVLAAVELVELALALGDHLRMHEVIAEVLEPARELLEDDC